MTPEDQELYLLLLDVLSFLEHAIKDESYSYHESLKLIQLRNKTDSQLKRIHKNYDFL